MSEHVVQLEALALEVAQERCRNPSVRDPDLRGIASGRDCGRCIPCRAREILGLRRGQAANPPKVPADWVQISKGIVPCNHVGMIDRFPLHAICGNCIAEWAAQEGVRK